MGNDIKSDMPLIWKKDEMSSDLIRRMREEPFPKEALVRVFSDIRFGQGLNFLVERSRSLKAEGGLTVYKKLGSQSLRFNRRYGLADSYPGDIVYEPGIASVDNIDPEDIDPTLWLIAGRIHSHPPGNACMPSQADVDIFEDSVNSAESEIVIPSKNGFDMIVFLPKVDSFHCQIFAYSLPGRIMSATYLDMDEAKSAEESEIMLRKAGFKVVRAIVPVMGSRVMLRADIISKLAEGLAVR